MGLLGLTRVGSRRVVQISSAFMIFFALLGLYDCMSPRHILISEIRNVTIFNRYTLLLNQYIPPFELHAGKFGAVFASIPVPIYAALYCVLFGLVGRQIIMEIPYFLYYVWCKFMSLCLFICRVSGLIISSVH